MDFSGFGALGGMPSNGGLFGAASRLMNPQPGVAPAVPADGEMQATIGPGMPAAPPAYTPKLGLPKGGLLGVMQGGQANGIMGMLQNKFPGLLGGGPLAGGMPPAGMLPGMNPGAAETPAGLPMNITRDNQF